MKNLFTFKPDHVIDIITNSSSELFVLKGQTLDTVKQMVSAAYPSYSNEYAEIKPTSELTIDEIQTYLSYCINYSSSRKDQAKPLPGFTYDEMYEEEKTKYSSYIHLKWGFVTDENKERVVKAMDPKGEMFFMFSHDDNPDWDMQEKLMEIGDRYHLG